MTLTERCASLYGRRPVQVFDPDFDTAEARERRAIVRQATGKADSLLQIQVIFHCGLVFGLLIAPFPIAIGAYLLMQLTELHALIVYRAVYRVAQHPKASLTHFKKPIRQLSYSLSTAGGICLILVYATTPESWNLGVLAGCGLAAAYFIPFAKHNGALLFTTLGILQVSMFAAVFARAFKVGDVSIEAIAAPLALVLFIIVTTIAIAVNVRVEYFKRLDDEELIEHAFTKLKAESRAKSILLAQLSHEIRTPLNGLLGGVELLRTKEMPEDQRALVDVMHESGGNLVVLLDRMLDMSASEVGAISIRPGPAVLSKVIRDEVALFSSRAQQAGVDLTMADGFCLLPRRIDEVRVRQCLANLIANAIDHSGGDRVAVSFGQSDGDKVRILISDNGQGVPDHRRNGIFQPFGDKGLEGPHSGQGAGLGLALSRAIAKTMGGDLTLQDDAHGGATFVLSFEAPLISGADADCKEGRWAQTPIVYPTH